MTPTERIQEIEREIETIDRYDYKAGERLARELLTLCKSEYARGFEDSKAGGWLIWSNEHKAFWRPGSRGYVYGIEAAGRYSLAEATRICCIASKSFNEGKNPDEIMTPSPELISLLSPSTPTGDTTNA